METETYIDSMEFKVQELLKEVRLEYSPAVTKLVDDTVSAIKSAIAKIPEDLQVFKKCVYYLLFFLFIKWEMNNNENYLDIFLGQEKISVLLSD